MENSKIIEGAQGQGSAPSWVLVAMQCNGDRDGSTHVCASSLEGFISGVGLEGSCAQAWSLKAKEGLAKSFKAEPLQDLPYAVTFSNPKDWPEHALAIQKLREALRSQKAKPGLVFDPGCTTAVQEREGAVLIWVEISTSTVGGFKKADAIARSMARSLALAIESKGFSCLEFEHNEEAIQGDSIAQEKVLAWGQAVGLAKEIALSVPKAVSKRGSGSL